MNEGEDGFANGQKVVDMIVVLLVVLYERNECVCVHGCVFVICYCDPTIFCVGFWEVRVKLARSELITS